MKPAATSQAAGARGPERMDVSPERAQSLREAARQGGEAEANVGLVLVIFLAAYFLWSFVSGML